MIFILHYILFNAGAPAITILLTLYLQTYSQTSLTEIGTLLMILPFVSIIVKPLFCALADRYQAHRHFLAGSNLFMILGYGSLAIAPFFPAFSQQNGRLIWYLFVVGVTVGFSAFGVVWSLGDALAVQAANRRGVPWGAYRVWATLSWGVFGYIDGQINELPALPKYTPALFVLILATSLEIFLLLVWPNEAFNMNDKSCEDLADLSMEDSQTSVKETALDLEKEEVRGYVPAGTQWSLNYSLKGTMNAGTARMNARLVNAMAGIFAEDIGSTLKSSLHLGKAPRRVGLDELLQEHKCKQQVQGAPPSQQTSVVEFKEADESPLSAKAKNNPAQAPAQAQVSPSSPLGTSHYRSMSLNKGSPRSTQAASSLGAASGKATLARAMLMRTQQVLSRMNSLSAKSGHAISDETYYYDFEPPTNEASPERGARRPLAGMVMSSLASNASLGRATAARALGFVAEQKDQSGSQLDETTPQLSQQLSASSVAAEAANTKSIEDLQLVLLKLIIKRDPNIYKYLVLFTLFGFLLFAHISFFFLHVEQLCRQKGYDFSAVMGALVVAQSISEIFTFLVVVPLYIPRVGRLGSMVTCAIVFGIRYAYYGSYYEHFSPYTAIATETCHGLAYAITYTLITDVATDCVNQVDNYMPELIKRKLVDPKTDPNLLKLPLRATMQGVFGGAFDGLGNGFGALFAGIFLDYYNYVDLWRICAYCSLAIAIFYPISELRSLCNATRLRPPKR